MINKLVDFVTGVGLLAVAAIIAMMGAAVVWGFIQTIGG